MIELILENSLELEDLTVFAKKLHYICLRGL